MKKAIKQPKNINLPHWSEKYAHGGELFLPAVSVFVFLVVMLTGGSIFFSKTSAALPYKTIKCQSATIQYGLKCYGETTLLITGMIDTLIPIRDYFTFGIRFLPEIKKITGSWDGALSGLELSVPDVKEFTAFSNNQYTARTWQLNELSKFSAAFYFDEFAARLKLNNFSKLPGWFKGGLYEWGANYVFHRVAGKNLDQGMPSIQKYFSDQFAEYLKSSETRDALSARFSAITNWQTPADWEQAIVSPKRDFVYRGGVFYFVNNLADKYGKDKFMGFVIAAGDSGDIDASLKKIYGFGLDDYRTAVLAELDADYAIYASLPLPPPAAVTPPAPTPALEEPAIKEEFVVLGNTYFGSHPEYNCRDPLYTNAGSGSYLVGCVTASAVWRWWGVEEISVGSYKNMNLIGNLGLFGTTSYGNNIGAYVLADDPRPNLSSQCPAIGAWDTDCLPDTSAALAACEVAGRSSAVCDVNAAISGRDKVYIVFKVVDPSTANAARGDFNTLKIILTK